MGNQGGEFWRGGGVWGKTMPDWAEVWSVGTSQNRSDRVTQAGWGFQTKTHNKMTTRRDYSGHPVTRMKLAVCLLKVELMFWGMCATVWYYEPRWGKSIGMHCSLKGFFFLQVFRAEEPDWIKVAAVTSRTRQISSELSQVSVEVVELDLRCQEDVLRFRKWEYTLVCAGVLVE